MKTKGMVLKKVVMVILPLLLLVPILRAPFTEASEYETVIGIESAEDMEAGSIFILSIYLENVIKTTGIGAPTHALTWDPSVLKLLGIAINPLAPEGSSISASNINNTEGAMTFALINDNPPDYITVIEKKPILDLTFEAVGSPGNTTILNLDNLELSYEDFNVYPPDVVIDGFVSMRAQYPVTISVGGNEMVFFADHISDLKEGNWIELGGGTEIKLPSLTLSYDGPNNASYPIGGTTVTVNSTFTQKQLIYPLGTHQVYKEGNPVSATFWGSTDFAGEEVSFRLFRSSSLLEIKDILDMILDKNIGGIINTLSGIQVMMQSKTLDTTGDKTCNFYAPAAGDYILIIMKIDLDIFNPLNSKFHIYSATAIEVVDYTLDVFVDPSVMKGEDLNIEATLIDPPSGSYTYGFAMIKESSLGNMNLVTNGTVPSTQLYLNGEIMADGNLFTDFFTGNMGQSDLNITLIENLLNKAFDPDELAFGHTTATNTGSISLSTLFLTPGEYVLFVGAWKDFETRIVGLNQTTVTVTSPGLPVAKAGGPYTGKPGVAITFNGANSYDPDGTIVSYYWTFGDGGTETGVSPSHTYTADGVYIVTLTVTDDDGLTAIDTTTATISTPTKPPPPPPPYIPPINKPPVAEAGPNQMVYVDELTHFSGAGSYDPDGTILFYDWDFGDGTTASGISVSHAYSESGIYTVNLTVMDDRIADGSDTCTITVLEIIPLPPIPPILSNLTVTPSELERGDNVTISLDIENIDNQSFTYIVTMHIENVNEPPSTWPPYGVTLLVEVELGAYEAKTVSRTITMETVGDFNVTVDGLTGSFTVETPEIPLKPAEFVVSYLHIKPEKIELGEGIDVYTFEISVDVTNVGERTGSHTVELKMDGEVVESRTVILIGGKETSIVFDVTRGVGSYAVEVDGLTGSFLVKPYLRPMKPAEFEVSDLILTPSEAQPGATIIVSAKIANIGEMEGNYTLELKLDGETVETESVTLAGGTSQEISFTISSEEEGTHTVEIYELSGSFTIKSPPPKKPIWPSIILVMAVVAVLVYLIWVRTDWIQQLIEQMGIDGDVHQELP